MSQARMYIAALVCGLTACAQTPRTGPAQQSGPAATPAPAVVVPVPAPAVTPAIQLSGSGTVDRSAPPTAPGKVAAGFDLAAYLADPVAYCRATDGSRCNHVAQPGATTAALQSVGPGSFLVVTGGSVGLRAQTAPGMPVSFTSQGLGQFPASGQSAITVQADAAGVATAEFLASAGTVGHCLIIAGSPVRAGNVSFLVTIQE